MCVSMCTTVHVKGKTFLRHGFLRNLWLNSAENVQYLKKKKKKKKQLKKPAARLGFGEGLAEASEPMKQAEAGLANNSVPCSSFGGRSSPPLCKCLSPESLPPLPGLKQLLSPCLSSSSRLRLTFSSIESSFGSNHGASEWLLPESPAH